MALNEPGLNGGLVRVLNAIRTSASEEYQNRIPEATRQNIADIGNAMINYSNGQNEFINSLMNKIAFTIIKNKLYQNPLAEFKKGTLELGDTVEEIFLDLISAQTYTLDDTVSPFKINKPNSHTIFHRLNRQDKYKVTIAQDLLMKAFTSFQSLEDFVSKIIENLYTSANYDEFLFTKKLIADYNNKSLFYQVPVEPVTDEKSGKEFSIKARQISTDITFMSNQYNSYGVYTHTPQADQVIFVRSDYEARMSVDVLAYAFNMDKADFLSRRVVVDNFGGDENDKTVAVLVDTDWFRIYDRKFEMTDLYNPDQLYTNYWLHVWQVLSTSRFANAIAFIEGGTTTGFASTMNLSAMLKIELQEMASDMGIDYNSTDTKAQLIELINEALGNSAPETE